MQTTPKRPKKKVVLAAVGGLAVCVGIWQLYEHWTYVSTDNAQVEAHTLLLSAKVSAYVVAIPVEDGQAVKKGDLLVQLDDRDYKNALTIARADLASNEARRRDTERNFRRLASLYQSAAVTQQQFDAAQTQYVESKARYDAIDAQVAQAQLNLDNTRIVAPEDGFVAKRSAEIGQLAAVGTPLVGFVSGKSRWVVANLKETDLDGVVPGREAEVTVDALKGQTFHGKVEAIFPTTGSRFTLLPPDNATGNFTKVVQRVPVRVGLVLENPDEQLPSLRAGLSADVRIRRR